jgi:hypothetical protein
MAEAYEMKPDTFQVRFDSANINGKFPTLKIEIKFGDEKTEVPVWVRHHEKFGYTFAGNTPQIVGLIGKLFGGAIPQQKSAAKPAADRNSLIR